MGSTHLRTGISNILKQKIRHPLAVAMALAFSGTANAATFTVSNTANSGAGSLRQAIIDANAAPGADDIDFSIASGSTITLSGSELGITDSLSITGPTPGDPGSVIINGNASSRIINAFIPANGALNLNNLTLSNGKVNGRGGGLKVAGAGSGLSSLTLNDTLVTGNSTSASGSYHEGGGLYVSNANITLNNSTVSNNKTEAIQSPGGGIFVNEVIIRLDNTTLSGNHTSGAQSSGGGFYADGATTLNNSTVSGNWTSGNNSSGGGLYIFLDEPQNQNAIINQSTISGNSTSGSGSHGGGVAVFKGDALINQSTITNNSSSGAGGGLFALVQNHSVFLNNSILSGNTGFLGNLYGATPTTGKVNSSNSIFGDSPFEITGSNISNIINNSPNLGPLQNNGGPTLSHLPNVGSIALNKGNNANAAAFANDQRGPGFTRIQNSTVDIGSVERQVVATKPVLVSPLGTSVNPPAFKWRRLAGASSYRLVVNEIIGTSVSGKIDLSYTAAQAGCSNTDICEVSPDVLFAIASGEWWVTAITAGQNKISDRGLFSIVLPAQAPPNAPSFTPPSSPTTETDTSTSTPDISIPDTSTNQATETDTSTSSPDTSIIPTAETSTSTSSPDTSTSPTTEETNTLASIPDTSTSQTESSGGGSLSVLLLGLWSLLGLFRRELRRRKT